jgi:hypothetical protein
LVIEKSDNATIAQFLKNTANGLLWCLSPTSTVGDDATLLMGEQDLARKNFVWILSRVPTNSSFDCLSPSHLCLASPDKRSHVVYNLKQD